MVKQIQIRFSDNKVFKNNDCQEPHMTIDELHPDFKKVMRGYAFRLENGTINFVGGKDKFDHEAMEKKLKNNTASDKDIQQCLLYLLGHIE